MSFIETNWKEELVEAFRTGLTPPNSQEIYEWAHDHCTLHNAFSIPGKFDVSRSKFLVEPFKALKDLRVREVNVMASPRCAKTLLAELYLLHFVANNAGNVLWLQSSDEMMAKMNSIRIVPLLKGCPPIKAMIPDMQKFNLTKTKLVFPHMNVVLSSAKIKALQSLGYKACVFDECWLADQGFIGEARMRLQDFQHTSKFLLLSQGGVDGDEWTTEFTKAPLYEWGFVCPSCKKEQPLLWNRVRPDGKYSGIIWDKVMKDGKYDYAATGKTARLVCHFCEHEIHDNPSNRRWLNDNGVYVCTNPEGDPRRKSFRWNALANIEILFSDLVVEYLQAKDILAREGSKIPLQEFTQKRLAKSWNENTQMAISKIITAEYDVNEAWGDYTFMTIDCQNNLTEFYYVIRRWAKNGESRLLKYGRAPTFQELRRIQTENKIRDQNVLLDTGHMATQCYAKCCEYSHIGVVGGKKVILGWIALKGWDSYDFDHPDGIKKIYSTESRGDPNMGKDAKARTCPLYRWSNKSVKDILIHLRDGKGVKWLAKDVDDEYQRQMNSEVLTRTIDKKTNKEKWIYVQRTGVPNHYFDCECMQVVGAAMVNIFGKLGQGQD